MRTLIFLTLFICSGCMAARPAAAQAEIVPVDLSHGPILVHLHIGASAPVWAIFDTGSQGAVLTLDYAHAQHLPDQGADEVVSPLGGEAIHGFRTTVTGARVEGVRASAFAAIAVPMDMGTPQAILGPDAFAGRLVTIDIAGSRLIVSPRGDTSPPGVESDYGDDGLPTIAVNAGGHDYVAHLDTGSDSPLSMSLALAGNLPLAAPPHKTGRAQSVQATFDVYSAQLVGDMRVGPLTLHNPTIEFFDAPGAGAGVNVGRATLARMLVTIDPERRRVWTSVR